MQFNSEESLNEFGNSWHVAGKWCRVRDCFSCWAFWICPPKNILDKSRWNTDYVLRNLELGKSLDQREFHRELKGEV